MKALKEQQEEGLKNFSLKIKHYNVADTICVQRLLEYTGSVKGVYHSLKHRAIKGSYTYGKLTIEEIPLHSRVKCSTNKISLIGEIIEEIEALQLPPNIFSFIEGILMRVSFSPIFEVIDTKGLLDDSQPSEED